MIAYLKGKVLNKTEKDIILNTGNIGYSVRLPKPTLEKIKEKEELELFIHSHIREDAFDLYGFTKHEELDFFKLLITINGIGPKIALEILTLPIEKTKLAIAEDDSNYISRIPGIGSKKAKRIILELKGKIEISDLHTSRSQKNLNNENIDDEAIEALVKLGYQRHEIKNRLRKIPQSIKTTEDIITYFLKNA